MLQIILENQAFQRAAKFIEMKGIVLLVKINEMYNTFKSLSATRYLSRHEGGT